MAILAFDLTSSTSYDKLREIFIPLLQDSVDNCLTVVVGTKQDLVESKSEDRQVRSSQGIELAQQQHQFQLQRALKHNPNTFLKDIDPSKLYYETSSKTGKGVDKLFEDIQCMLLNDLEKAGTGGNSAAAKGAKVKPGEKDKVVRLGDQTDGGPPRQVGEGKTCCG